MEHAAVSGSGAARTDIVDILRLSKTQFGDQARQQAKHPSGKVKKPRQMVFYRVANDDVIEVVRLLHEAMEVPND
ncbi:hypothetical protein LJR277_003357 [Pseudomonas sp. LjRoot277]